MKVIVFSSSPNDNGLTAACAAAAAAGVRMAGGQADEVRLTDAGINACVQCNNGWGACRTEHVCRPVGRDGQPLSEDGFEPLHRAALQADALILVTPVYWGDLSEAAKAFTDRLRRCEASRGDESGLRGKPVICVAAAGGSGGGMITCLLNMERWIQHVRARTWDLIPVNRWSRPYKLIAIREAGRAMTAEAKPQG
jgi:multimeric flavodoxin WrbA